MTSSIEQFFGQYLRKNRDTSIPPKMVSATQAALLSAEARESGVHKGKLLTREQGQLMWGSRAITTYDPRQVPGKNRHTKATIGDVYEFMYEYAAEHSEDLAMPWIVDELRRYAKELVPIGYYHHEVFFFGEHETWPHALGVRFSYFGGFHGASPLILPEDLKKPWPEGAKVALITPR